MIAKTEAVVLSAMKFRDTSKIVRLYTKEFGKVSVIAKGARDAKSKFRGSLEPMNYVGCVIYRNNNRELQLLSQCDIIQTFRSLSDSMEKMFAAMSAVELVDIVSHGEDENQTLFDLLLNHIRVVNSATKQPSLALYYFETKLSELLGFKPELMRCTHCENCMEREEENYRGYATTSSGILCANCSEGLNNAEKISTASLAVLQRLQAANVVDSIMDMQLQPGTHDEVQRSLRSHLQNHIEGFRGLHSEEVFAAIL